MASEMLRPAAAQTPAIATSSVLVVSHDASQRQSLVLRLNRCEALDVSSASGFHMAVPMIWDDAPDVLVLGCLPPADVRRLPELRHHARDIPLVVVGRAGCEYDGQPDACASSEENLLAVLARLRPGS
jgi:chemotaxis response regulator CheB